MNWFKKMIRLYVAASIFTVAHVQAQLPPGTGWFPLANTQLQSVCPPVGDNQPSASSSYNFPALCHAVIDAWSGAVADTQRNRMIVWGGGHGDYSGNEIYSLDLNNQTLTRLNHPSPINTDINNCTPALSDGLPNSRHDYGGLAYIQSADRMYVEGGSLACGSGGGVGDTWTLNLASVGSSCAPGCSSSWQRMDPTNGTSGHPDVVSNLANVSDYDPNTQQVFVDDRSQFWSYAYNTNTYTVRNNNAGISLYMNAAIDPKRRLFIIIGQQNDSSGLPGGPALQVIDIGTSGTYAMQDWSSQTTGCGGMFVRNPGIAYDSALDRTVVWNGGDTVYLFNPDTKSCTTQTFSGGPGAQTGEGTYGRFRYFPSLDVFALVNGASQNAYILRLNGGAPPPPDTTPPTVAITSPANGATISGTISISGTAADNVAVSNVVVSVDGGAFSPASGTANWTFSLNTTTLSNGSHTLLARATDSSGNTGNSATVTVTVSNSAPPPDTTPPTVSITSPASGATVSGTISVAGTAADNVAVANVQVSVDGGAYSPASGTTSWTFSVNTTNLTNASHAISARATDTSGNVSTVASITVTVNNSSPPPGLISLVASCDSGGGNATGISCSIPATAGDLVVAFANDKQVGAPLTLSDTMGNTWSSAPSATNSATPATTQIFYAIAKNSGNDTITMGPNTDTSPDMIVLEYSGVAATSPLDANAQQPAPSSTNQATSGNAATANANDLLIGCFSDLSSVGTITAGSGWTMRVVNTSEYNGCEDQVVTTAGGYAATATLPVTDAAWTAHIAAFRSAGPASVAVNISPTNASVQTGGTQQFTATVTGNTNTSVTWSVNGINGGNSTVGTVSTSGLYTAPTSVPNPATITMTATSAADTTKSASASATITALSPTDTTPPTVSITAPANGTTVSGTITVSATAWDNVGVAGVQFKLDGANLGAEVAAPPYSVAWNTAQAINGSHVLTATARDAAGNSAVNSVSAAVSNAPPSPPPPPSGSGNPVLLFSDLDSGPNTGNTDTSLGQTAGQDGAIVSVWGQNLGTSQGSSSISINGAPAAKVYYWGNAVPPYSPANLNNAYQHLQLVMLQVSHLAANGAGTISVTVNGKTSNTIPFTVRAGRIFFVTAAGNDSTGNGTWQNPWQTIPAARDAMTQNGDITYIGDGVNQTTQDSSFGVALRINTSGAAGSPKTLAAYPGARTTIGSPTIEALDFFAGGTAGHTFYWTLSKITITGPESPLGVHTGTRIVGSVVRDVPGKLDDGAAHVDGNDIYFLGNEFTNIGDVVTPSSLYHTLYVSGLRDVSPQVDETNRVIAWNYFHDNAATRAINVYSEPAGAGSDLIKLHSIHHNVIVNQRGDGILLGFWVSGQNWVYDNLIINSGLGPEPSDQTTHHACIDFRAGDNNTGNQSGNVMHVFNNTMYNCGFSGGGNDTGALVLFRTAYWTPDFHNNIAYQNNGQPYISGGSDSTSSNAVQWSNDLWFGAGAAPSWDSNIVNADPQFVVLGSDFHLQSGSPAIDKGTSLVASVVTTDFDGNPRPQGAGFDLGAYEFTNSTGTPPPPDTTPPTVAITSPANGATVSGTIILSGTAADNVAVTSVQVAIDNGAFNTASGAANWSFSLNTASLPNGSHTISTKATDTSGNVSTVASITVMVNNSVTDTTPPSVPTGLSAVAVSSTQINLSWVASTDNVGVAGYRVFQCQGTGCIPSTQIATTASTSLQNMGLMPSTTYTYAVSAFDAAGNVSAQSAGISGVTLPPNAAPNPPPVVSPIGFNVVDVDTVTPGLQIYEGTSVTYTGTASDSDGDLISWQWLYTVNGGSPILMASGTGAVQPVTFNYPVGIAPKTYIWILSASDGFSTVQQTLKVDVLVRPDTTPPTASITSPANGSILSGTVAISATASDNVGVTRVELYLGNTLVATDTAAPYGFSWNTQQVANGGYTLTAKAYDAAGNVGTSSPISVTIQNRHSKVQLVSSPSLSFTVTSLLAGISSNSNQANFSIEVDTTGEPSFPVAPTLQVTVNMPSGSKSLSLSQLSTSPLVYYAKLPKGQFGSQDFTQLTGTVVTITVGTQTFIADGHNDQVQPALGGTIQDPNGIAAVVVQPGQVTQVTQVNIAPASNTSGMANGLTKLNSKAVGNPINIQIISSGTVSATTIVIPFDPMLISSGLTVNQVGLVYQDPVSGNWVLGSNVSLIGNAAAMTVQSGATFVPALLMPSSIPGLRDTLVFPNPAVYPQNPTIRAFLGQVSSVEITIFDAAGEVVNSASLGGSPTGISNGQYYYDYIWSGKKSSGIYFAVIHGKAADGTIVRARTKFAIVR